MTFFVFFNQLIEEDCVEGPLRKLQFTISLFFGFFDGVYKEGEFCLFVFLYVFNNMRSIKLYASLMEKKLSKFGKRRCLKMKL